MLRNRVFFVAYRPFSGFVGGSSGVNYRLYFFEKEYNVFSNNIENFSYIFKDRVIDSKDIHRDHTITNNLNKQDSLKNTIKENIVRVLKYSNFIYNWLIKYLFEKNIQNGIKYFAQLNEKYCFNDSDIFIMQDLESAICLQNIISSKNLIIYHGQGTQAKEIASLKDIELNTRTISYFDKLQEDIFNFYDYISFPSKGASQIVLDDLKGVERRKKDNILPLYNTYNEASFTQQDVENFMDTFEHFADLQQDCYKFISIGTLSNLKGFDRTIEVLGELKKQKINFVWFMIGNGGKSYIEKLNTLLKKNNIYENTVQIRRLPNLDINILLSKTDFYIMMQRFSIFDIATLEAMNNENIPILSNVGGNKEYNIKNNVFLYLNNTAQLVEFLKKVDLEKYKKDNKAIALNTFGPKAFLDRYLEYILNISK